VNGHPNSLLEKDKNQILFNGSDSNNGVKAPHQDCSTMKFLIQHGLDTVGILTTLRRPYIHLLMLIRTNNYYLALILPLKKAEMNTKKNGM